MYNLDSVLEKLADARQLTVNAQKKLNDMQNYRKQSVFDDYAELAPDLAKLIEMLKHPFDGYFKPLELRIGKFVIEIGVYKDYDYIVTVNNGEKIFLLETNANSSMKRRIFSSPDEYAEMIFMIKDNFDTITAEVVRYATNKLDEIARKINDEIKKEEDMRK